MNGRTHAARVFDQHPERVDVFAFDAEDVNDGRPYLTDQGREVLLAGAHWPDDSAVFARRGDKKRLEASRASY